MKNLIDDGRPIFIQIAERIEDDIISGSLPEESQVPSTNSRLFIRSILLLPQRVSILLVRVTGQQYHSAAISPFSCMVRYLPLVFVPNTAAGISYWLLPLILFSMASSF